MPHSSAWHSMAPTPEIPSTANTAGVSATTRPIASIGCPVPVEVSLRVPMTQAVSGCCRSASATRSGSTGWPHSKSSDTALMPNALQILTHRAAKWPAFSTSALPPGGTALTAAASIAPVPEAVRIRTSFCVRKTSLSPAATSVITSLASAERWWITGRASSSSTSSGTIAGPGVINRGLRISRILCSVLRVGRRSGQSPLDNHSIQLHPFRLELATLSRGQIRVIQGPLNRRPSRSEVGLRVLFLQKLDQLLTAPDPDCGERECCRRGQPDEDCLADSVGKSAGDNRDKRSATNTSGTSSLRRFGVIRILGDIPWRPPPRRPGRLGGESRTFGLPFRERSSSVNVLLPSLRATRPGGVSAGHQVQKNQ
jgi:hypothetical protein